jgi:hypothetical protein
VAGQKIKHGGALAARPGARKGPWKKRISLFHDLRGEMSVTLKVMLEVSI